MHNSPADLSFPLVSGKTVSARFDGGDITSDAGFLLLAQADRKIRLCERLQDAILDKRQQSKLRHPLLDLLRERIYAIGMGYEDANDLDSLADDPALKVGCGRRLTPDERLASQPTMSRLENDIDTKDLYCMAEALAQLVVAQLPSRTKKLILDIDASEDPCHGQQELEFFNGHYKNHCYLPLYLHVTADGDRQRLLTAMLRPGNADAKDGLFGLLKRAISLLKRRFPSVEITLRADSGFGQAQVIDFCVMEGISFVLGLPTNERIKVLAAPLEQVAIQKAGLREDPVRYYAQFHYQADTWHSAYRVVERIEITNGVVNARFVVTNFPVNMHAEAVYEFYCGRGEQENSIKEMKLGLSSGRTSCHWFTANQFRLLLHAAAAVLMSVLQDALAGTSMSRAQIATLRLRLLKLGAQARQSCRRIRFRMSSSFPWQDLWQLLYARLTPT